jgi:hypothetical protein
VCIASFLAKIVVTHTRFIFGGESDHSNFLRIVWITDSVLGVSVMSFKVMIVKCLAF